MSFFRGGLKIQNEVYSKKVREPSYAEILQLPEEQLSQIMDLKIATGEAIEQDENVFVGFSKAVNNYQDIRKLYMHLKLKLPKADHIMCAYNIPSDEQYYNKDHCDDGKFGISRHTLNMLNQNKIPSRVVFVARYSKGKKKIGQNRVDMALRAAKSAIEKSSYNQYTKADQRISNMKPPEKQRPPVGTPRQEGPGGARGRGGMKRVYNPPTKQQIDLQKRRETEEEDEWQIQETDDRRSVWSTEEQYKED